MPWKKITFSDKGYIKIAKNASYARSMELFIEDYVTPSQNHVEKMHWTEKMKLRDGWYWQIRKALQKYKWDRRQWKQEPKSVHIVRVAKRLIDDQNMPSGTKYLVDALVKEGVLVEDSRRWARISFDQRKVNKDEVPHMKIIINPMSESDRISM